MLNVRIGRWLAVLLISVVLFEAGATSPAFVLAEEPTSSAAPESAPPSQPGNPTADPASSPSPVPSPGSTPPDETPGVERLDLRTASSRTLEQSDGSFLTEYYAEDLFYKPDGSGAWQPIDTRFQLGDGADVAARVDDSPAQTSLAAADAAGGFLTLAGGGHSISFGLPAGTTAGRAGVQPEIKENGLFAEYPDFLPGGIALRIFPQADGFNSFLVLPSRPAANTFAFAIRAPGIELAMQDDGTATFVDELGNVIGRIPRPFAIDSSDVDGRGGGLYSDAVSMTIAVSDAGYVLTLAVEPKFLDTAVYPVYLDPSPTTFPTGSTTTSDTFAAERYPGSNFNTYQRPDSPYYKEMWHGKEPGYTTYDEVFIRFNTLGETLGGVLINSASLQMYPYWQYNHVDPKPTWVERIAADWASNTLTWNNKPSTNLAYGSFDMTEEEWSDVSVISYVQDVANGVQPNYGLKLHANTAGNGSWKRFVSANDASGFKPKLVVGWTAHAQPSIVYPNGGGETSSRTLTWESPDGSVQTSFETQIATNTGFTTGVVTFPVQTSANPFYMIPTTTTLTEGTPYYWRVRVKYGMDQAFPAWPSATYGSFTYRQGATLGMPAHNTFESFGLGSGDSASVNVSTGNLVVSHPIVSLPLRGGSLGFGLTYNSHSYANAGTGPGWRLNAMRRLAELGNGNVVFTAGDGSVHTFTKISTVGTVTTYTRPATVYATLRKDTSQALEWTLTYRDQSVDSFDLSGSEGLLAKQADRFGNAVTFSYYSGTNRLKDATDPAGRMVDFAWDTGVSPARLTSITDWAYVSGGAVQASATGSRRVYRLFYDSNGYLIGWSNPLNTSGSCPTMASNLTCLAYTSTLLSSITKRQTIATLSGGAIGTSSPRHHHVDHLPRQ